MKILIIPDIHGRDFWVEPCSHVNEFDKIIFLGDYVDPYSFQCSKETARHQLRDKIVPFVWSYRDKVICLAGNHDIGEYIVRGAPTCRTDVFHRDEIAEYLKQLDMQLFYKVDNYLFSHSGILPLWLEENNLSLEDLDSLDLTSTKLFDVSPYRGGYGCKCGSMIWGDVEEYYSSKHLADYYQIFGHTQLKENPIIEKDFACLDCRQTFVLDTETKELVSFNDYNNK